MNRALTTLLLATSLPFLAHTQSFTDTNQLREAVVTGVRDGAAFNQTARQVTVITREEIERMPAQNVNEVLEHVLNIDMRQRGQLGVQADVSLRGASFEQTLILLNGIKLTDPQTGHHNMNLPVDMQQIERIEILNGGGSRIFGPNAFAGAINIITKNGGESSVGAHITGGEYGFFQTGANANIAFKKHSHQIAVNRSASDGYIPNSDFELTNIFWQSQLDLNEIQLFVNGGQTDREFGAQNFYSSSYPDQFEATQTQFISAFGEIDLNPIRIKPRVYYRRHRDRFELFREGGDWYQRLNGNIFVMGNDTAPSWYDGHNYHLTEVIGAEMNASVRTQAGITSFGFDYRKEDIKSNVLGTDLDEPEQVEGEHSSAFYRKSDGRENWSLYAEHNWNWNKLFVSAGTMLNLNSDFDDEWFPGIDVAYQFTPAIRGYGSFNRSVRFPSFTDLYYSLGGAIGSDSLKPEKSLNYEAGVKIRTKYAQGHVAFFRREGRDLIDWIRFNGSDITQAANITEFNINGIETQWSIGLESLVGERFPVRRARVGYTYMWADSTSSDFESNYVLDFLRQKIDVSLDQYINESLWLTWAVTYQDRVGGYFSASENREVSFDPVLLTNVRLTHRMDYAHLFVEVANLFDQTYSDIGNIVQPGRWIRAGVNVQVPLKRKRSKSVRP